MNDENKLKSLISFAFASIFLSICVIFLTVDSFFNINAYKIGVFPRDLKGLPGIFLAQFIHANLEHFLSNAFSVFILIFSLKYFFFWNAYSIFFSSTILVNFLVWLIGRPSFHIGSSGIVFFLSSFFLFIGFFSKKRAAAALSLISLLIYGASFQELYPSFDSSVSWEAHLVGFGLGVLYAFIYRNDIDIEEIKYEWENDALNISPSDLKIKHDD